MQRKLIVAMLVALVACQAAFGASTVFTTDRTQGMDPYLDVSGARISGACVLTLTGYVGSVTEVSFTGPSKQDVWPGDSGSTLSYTWQTTARTLEITSTSANDTSAGTGARTVYITGLSSTYAEQSETVTLSGLTAVETANTYLRLNSMYVATAGSGGTNAGRITARSATDGYRVATIYAATGETTQAIYTVPLGQSLRVRCLNSGASQAESGFVQLWYRPYGGVFRLIASGKIGVITELPVPISIPAKADLKLCLTGGSTTTGVKAWATLGGIVTTP